MKNQVILPAWNLIKEHIEIKKFYLFPGLLSIIFLTVLLVYQSIYTYVEIFWKKEEALVIILNFFQSDYIVEVIIVSIIFLILYFLITPIFEAGLIKYIDHSHKDIPIDKSEALGMGLYKFFPLFEYNNLFSEFKFMSVLNGYLFTIRFIGVEYIKNVSYIFLIIFGFSIIINILFSDKHWSKSWLLPGTAGWGISYLPLESFLMKLKTSGYAGFFTLTVKPSELGVGNEDKVLQNLDYAKTYYKKHFLNYK